MVRRRTHRRRYVMGGVRRPAVRVSLVLIIFAAGMFFAILYAIATSTPVPNVTPPIASRQE
jgi:hypothetical protein